MNPCDCFIITASPSYSFYQCYNPFQFILNLNKHLIVNTKLDVCAFYNLVDAFPNRQKAYFFFLLFVMNLDPKSKILIELKLKAGWIIFFYYYFGIMRYFMIVK